MRRVARVPRSDFEHKVEALGLTYHHTVIDGRRGPLYWDESACYELSTVDVDTLERATNELQQMCLAAAQYIIDHDRFADLAIPIAAIPVIKSAWELEPPAIYGRFDLRYDGATPPKLLEYNADTPTALLEASVIQWHWLQEVAPQLDQFNSIHEKLIDKWKDVQSALLGRTLFFVHSAAADTEDLMTTQYLRDTAIQAGLDTAALLIEQIGWDAGNRTFVDLDNQPMTSIFKLYPWEWMLKEPFGQYALESYPCTQWIEPIWKMLLSNKGLLAILWELFPEHPNLLPAFFRSPTGLSEYAVKPLLGREGAGVQLKTKQGDVAEPAAGYGAEGYIYQAYCPLPTFDGSFPVIGSWIIDQEPAGVGIRESDGLVTNNTSRFVPHLMV